MDDFGILARDFGYRPLGNNSQTNTPSMSKNNSAVFSDHDRGGGSDGFLFDDVFGGPPPKFAPSSSGGGGASESPAFDYDSAFEGSHDATYSCLPVFDKPVYDDEMFDGLPGVNKTPAASSAKFDDVFSSLTPPRGKDQSSAQFDDLMGDLGGKVPEPKTAPVEKDTPVFDDLLPGFGGGSSPAMTRASFASSKSQKPSSSSTKLTPNVMEDPFVVLESTSTPLSSSGLFTDPLDEISKSNSSGNTRVDCSFSGTVFDDVDPFDSLGKLSPQASSKSNHRTKDGSPLAPSPVGKEETSQFRVESFENHSPKKVPVDSFQEPHQFDMSNTSSDFHRSLGQATSPPSYASVMANEMNSHIDTSPRHEENLGTSSDIWLTVSEVPLFTQPTSAPPPSRPPPPRPARVSKSKTRPFDSTNSRNKSTEFSSFTNSTQYSYSPKSPHAATTSPLPSQIDELENFAMGSTQNNVEEHADVLLGEKVKVNSAAAAIKETMDIADANFRHAKEVREREHQKTARGRESVYLEKDEKTMQDSQEKELKERQQRLDRERQQREREEQEREQRRLEKEREQRRLEKAREMEREREKARQAVERATREARERAAAEARLRAERAAVEKAQAEARERVERAAVQRAQAEARERAVAEAKERAEKAAAEARERGARASASRAEADACFRAERASAERTAAAAAARVNQQKNDDDLESFFSMGSNQPSSTTMPRANSSDPLFDTETQSEGGPEVARRTSVGASSNIRKTSSSTNIVDDLTSIFGEAAPSSGGFQDISGETEERRRSRLERHQRTQERAAKALAEKNQRDLQAQREQAERHRIAVTLDVEIKRWAAGKEGNLRALLSTLHYVLWPECGWQPVSLTDMITAASVKKLYRKATLCIHPDKVQQKGANLQQKYIAEKVFDLLKEAWNKFNSEELF